MFVRVPTADSVERRPRRRENEPSASAARSTPGGAPRRRHRRRRGQALLEFAFIAVILIFLIGGALSLGHIFYSAHSLQQAADVAAQEIARMPFRPDIELGLGDFEADPAQSAMFTPEFLEQIYDERHLVIRQSQLNGGSFADYLNGLPLLNRLLASVMIFDPSYDPDGDGGVYRYPGAVVLNTETGHETVLIPLVQYDELGGGEVVQWLAPVEEMRVDTVGDGFPDSGPFSVIKPEDAPPGFVPGMVAIRINYPAQAAGLIGRHRLSGAPITADDADIDDPWDTGRYVLIGEANPDFDPQGASRIHAGRYGLGKQAAAWRELGVRPYRRVLSAQAVYRREVFQ